MNKYIHINIYYTRKRPTRVVYKNIKSKNPKFQKIRTLQKIQKVNYEIYIYNQIKVELWGNFQNVPKNRMHFALLVYFV